MPQTECNQHLDVVPNEETAAAIEEGKRIMQDSTIPQYSDIDELRSALEV